MHPLHPSPPHLGLPEWTSPVSLAKAAGSTEVRGGALGVRRMSLGDILWVAQLL